MKIRNVFICLAVALSTLWPTATNAQAKATPIRWEHMNTVPLTDPLAVQTERLIKNGVKFFVNDWYNEVKKFSAQTGRYLNFNGRHEHSVRPIAHAAFSLGVALRFGLYDEAVTGVPVNVARDIAIRLISSLAYRHKATSGDKEGWGKEWQSAWWAQQAAFAAWLLWDDIDATTRDQIYAMTVYEANRFLDYKIPYYKDRTGKIIFKGDSKSEENAWNSDLLVLATVMFPNHPNADRWHRMALELQLSAYASPSDLNNTTVVNGIRLCDFLQGSNMEEDGTIVNHGIVHVDYTVAFMQNAINVLPYALTDRKAYRASLFNGDRIYDALNHRDFNGHTMYVRGANGEATCEIFFPQGNDWGTFKQVNCWLMDVIAHVCGLDKGMNPAASDWMRVRGERMLATQARNANGSYYRDGEEGFPSREEWLTAQLAFGYLFQWADRNHLLRYTNSAKRQH